MIKNIIKIITFFILTLYLCMGCSADSDKMYTNEDLNNLAQIEIYTAADSGENSKLVKTITDEEVLYQYNNCSFWLDSDYSEEHQTALKEAVKDLTVQYVFVAYKYPAARFHKQTLEKELSITLYENSGIIKMTAAQESIKNISIPEEYLTFYFDDVPEEDLDFLRSLGN